MRKFVLIVTSADQRRLEISLKAKDLMRSNADYDRWLMINAANRRPDAIAMPTLVYYFVHTYSRTS